ncbi:MAG: hypothetical protein JSV66_19005 [Trueperaceae bacterium]|nr:MAG: hypothetical protein JSV66_19005 [Trueperaceae bacterium]
MAHHRYRRILEKTQNADELLVLCSRIRRDRKLSMLERANLLNQTSAKATELALQRARREPVA